MKALHQLSEFWTARQSPMQKPQDIFGYRIPVFPVPIPLRQINTRVENFFADLAKPLADSHNCCLIMTPEILAQHDQQLVRKLTYSSIVEGALRSHGYCWIEWVLLRHMVEKLCGRNSVYFSMTATAHDHLELVLFLPEEKSLIE